MVVARQKVADRYMSMACLKAKTMSALLACVIFMMNVTASLAVEPNEVLDDPALETRARALSAELRCLVCQNQSIDDSDAALAKDLRILVRQRLVSGDSDQQVMDYIVSRYGDFVLLKPRFTAKNFILWLTPLLVLCVCGAIALRKFKSSPNVTAVEELSDEEKSKIKQILEG